MAGLDPGISGLFQEITGSRSSPLRQHKQDERSDVVAPVREQTGACPWTDAGAAALAQTNKA
jgi:hypothetical protein